MQEFVRYFASGDGPFFYAEQIRQLSFLPRVFDSSFDLGISVLLRLWIDYPFRVFVKLLYELGISWWWIEKILWLGVFILGVYASYRLATYVYKRASFGFLASLIYTTNTYALLLFGGGQLGVALAYSLSPLVLLKFIRFIDQGYGFGKKSIANGLWFALLVCFDLRFAYMVMIGVSLYLVFNKRGVIRNALYEILYTIIVPLFIAVIIHLFWILPAVMIPSVVSLGGEEFTSPGMLQFLSVADFSHALSLLHPNWPENLFGKVYFLQPEFLMLPILAFSSLLFIHKRQETMSIGQKAINNKQGNEDLRPKTYELILFFAFLSLLGAFLAKGVNPPFGGINSWLFAHVPGFIMFRDPTKFYLYIALGYSILIPFTLLQILHRIHDKRLLIKDKTDKSQFFIIYLSSFIFLVFWCFTIRPLFLGQLAGNFQPLYLDEEFVRLKNMLVRDEDSSRTLWIPAPDKFSFSSDNHPVLSGTTLFKNASISAIMDHLTEPSFQETIQRAGVKYVVVPIDGEKRMFLSDYKWDGKKRDDLVASLAATTLVRHPEFQKLAVFENQTFTFSREKPAYVKSQEEWSRVGLIIGIMAIGVLSGVVIFVRR